MSFDQIYTKVLDMELFTEASKVSEYLCPLCTGVYFNPVVESCGHVFCRDCICKWFKSTGSIKICPINKTEFDSNIEEKVIRPLMLVQDILEKLELKCKNKCEWTGKLKDLFKHIDTECRNATINCVYASEGCEEKFLRSEREKHEGVCEFKPIPCVHCSSQIPLNRMSNHVEVCPKVRVDCPQNCNYIVERGEVEEHVKKTCENSMVDCIFHKLGCEEKSKRKDITEHLNSNSLNHNLLVVNSLVSLHEKVDKLATSQITQTNIELNNLANLNYDQIFKAYNRKKNSSEGVAQKKSENKHKTSYKKKNFISNKRERDLTNDHHTSKITPSIRTSDLIADYDKNYDNLNFDPNNEFEEITENLSEEYSDRTFTPLSLDFNYASRGLNINFNRAVNVCQVKNQHKFVFANLILNNPDENCDYIWRLTVNKKSSWFAFGCCQKERVISNDYKFVASLKEHGCFMLSSNGYSWSTNREDQNNVKVMENLSLFPQLDISDVIYLKYKKNKNELIINFKDFTWKLHNVTCPQGNYLVPCVVFIHYLDDVTFEYLARY